MPKFRVQHISTGKDFGVHEARSRYEALVASRAAGADVTAYNVREWSVELEPGPTQIQEGRES